MLSIARNQYLPLCSIWLVVIGLCIAIYSPGFSGGFIFDDFGNLQGLSSIQGGSLKESASYVLQGFAGPSGRPLSLLSFALQRDSWPGDPAAFKRINLLIHLFNGTLLLLLGLRLWSQDRLRKGWAVPLLAASLWLLWPIQISTVLYVVQRMSLLATTCVCAGLLLFVVARQALDRGQARRGHLLFGLAWVIGLPLGLLFKESAGVFPLVVLALDATLPAQGRKPRPVAWSLTLWGSVAAIGTYLLILSHPLAGFAARDFSMSERLLSEARVLWMYAGQIAAPSLSALKFVYDDYPVSRGLLAPAVTAWAVVGLLAATVLALCWRRRYPVAAFAILFFLANHALESSFLPLELIFEHRNYLASFGLALAVAAGFDALLRFSTRNTIRGAVAAAGITYAALVLLIGYTLTSLWGNDLALWAQRYQQHPESRRVQMMFAEQLAQRGHARDAAVVLEQAMARFPDDLALALARAELACESPDYKPASLKEAENALRWRTHSAMTAYALLDQLGQAVEAGRCPAYRETDVLTLVEAARTNSAMAAHRTSLTIIAGRLQSNLGHIDEARRLLQQAVAEFPKPDLLVQATVWEIGNQNFAEARRYLAMMGPDGPLPLRSQLAIREDRRKLEQLIAERSVPAS